MKGRKLLKLLQSLKEGEFQELSKAVNAPLLNTNERVGNLYDHLCSFFPKLEDAFSDEQALFAALFPGEPFDDYKLRRLLSAFTQVVESFLAMVEVKSDPETEAKLARSAYSRRNLYELFEKKAMSGLRALQDSPYRDADYYRQKVQLLESYYFHPLTEKHLVKPALLQELVESLDAWYALAKYRLAVELKNRELIFSEQYSLPAMGWLGLSLADKALEGNATYRAYKNLYLLYQQDEPAHFHKLKGELLTVIGQMREDDRLLLFQQLLNFAIRQVNQGQSHFYAELLGLYKLGLEYGLLADRGRMSEATYSNIALVGCEEGEFDWTYRFINDWAGYVEEASREDAKAHCFSLWHYFRKEYDKARDFILGHRFSEPFQPRARMLEIRITFEQFLKDSSYYTLLASQLNAFEKYLKRARHISGTRKEAHSNTLSLIRKAAKAIDKGEEMETLLAEAREEVDSGKPVALGSWLLKQLQQQAG